MKTEIFHFALHFHFVADVSRRTCFADGDHHRVSQRVVAGWLVPPGARRSPGGRPSIFGPAVRGKNRPASNRSSAIAMQPPPPLAMAALLASALVAARVASGVKVYPTYCLLLDMVDARCREVPLRPLEASGGDPIADNATPPSDPYGLYCALTIPFDARLLYNCLPNRYVFVQRDAIPTG